MCFMTKMSNMTRLKYIRVKIVLLVLFEKTFRFELNLCSFLVIQIWNVFCIVKLIVVVLFIRAFLFISI